ncbi:putative ethylene-insensitive protein 2-like [Capsicum annuum]|nr:putative ethylene-insensitive protein 2-like [Capsicum annuum]KAF3679452.1 putative ethylene-insensitive protein 2-like [Capsicum annuum]
MGKASVETAVEEGFISTNARQIIVSAPTATELVEKLEKYVPCHERVASKLNWEMEQQLGYPQAQEIGQ